MELDLFRDWTPCDPIGRYVVRHHTTIQNSFFSSYGQFTLARHRKFGIQLHFIARLDRVFFTLHNVASFKLADMFFADRKEKKLVQTTYILDRTKKNLKCSFSFDVGRSRWCRPVTVRLSPPDRHRCMLSFKLFFSYQFKIHEIIESKEKSWRRFARNARRLSCLGLRVTVDSFRVHFPYVRHNKLVLLFFQIFIQDKYHIFPPLKSILNFISVEYFQGDDLFYSNMSIDPTQ